MQPNGNYRTFAAVLTGGLFTTLGVGLFAFTIPLLSLDERVSGAWLGTAFAAYYLAKLLASPLAGMAADRFGPKPVLILATSAGCLIPLTYFTAPGLTSLYIVQAAMGLVSGLIRPVGLAALGGSASGPALSRRFAANAALFNAASFAGPIIGSLLYTTGVMGPVLIGLSVCLGLALAATLLLMPEDAATSLAPHPAESANPSPPRHRGKGAALLLAIGGRSLGIGLTTAFYPIVLADVLGRHGPVAAATFAAPGLATFLGLLITGRLTNKNPDMDRVVLGMFLSAGGLYALGECRALWQFITFGVILGLGAALSIPASMFFASTLSRRQGAVFGAANLASGLGFLLGPLLGGFAVHTLHSPAPALKAAAVIGALSCLPLLFHIFRDQFHWGRGMAWTSTGIAATLLGLLLVQALSPDFHPDDRDKDLYRFTDVAMGTVVKLTIEAPSRKSASLAARRTMTAMRALQQDLDHRNPRGSIGRINRAAGSSWVKTTPRAFALLDRALKFSAATDGAFDPTVGALTTSPFYYAMDESVARAKSGLVDYRMVLMDPPGNRVRLKKKGMALDLGGIAKGSIVDAAVALLKKHGVPSGIVEAGGDFRCFGDRDWNIGIRHPRNSAVFQTIPIRDKGVCGSGDYQQFVTPDKKGGPITRHHIIDPSTMDSAHESIGVTVVANTAELADALATTLFIMGPAKGTAFLKKYSPDSACIWFLPDGTVSYTDNFPQ
ncbi:MFS transporter [Pseudodesulfovibrio thermohalotolerans]|uniref:MFS transporter n=1 Tax=Pseudodesulfovibrio thermohalotolerans TaxID=2880651 RepID=UPI002441A460|nr:MFS transporter [Pseudodesulfovibrio thermohalotolerans]WFS63147.1 MFS transporter [Pseudodesulfovibrio thermohalotolerans]